MEFLVVIPVSVLVGGASFIAGVVLSAPITYWLARRNKQV